MEVKIIDEAHQEFNGVVYHKRISGYYSQNRCLLHREVWRYHRGDIPQGWHVHHIDENKDNNQLGNLQCLTSSEHKRLHAAKAVKIEVKCVVCGKTFQTTTARPAKCCSPHCYFKKKYVPAAKEQRVCLQCGKPFTALIKSRAQFCSRRCKNQHYYKEPKSCTCAICGKVFQADGRYSPRQTCSSECETILLKRSRATNTALIERQCAHCGKAFHTNAAKPSKFCSRNCRARYQAQNVREMRTCPVCGKEFSAVKSSKTKYCSRMCFAKSRAVPGDLRALIKAQYVKGSPDFGSRALAKKFNISPTIILDIVKN